MCGIAIEVSFEGRAEVSSVERGLRALRHRGPDGSGTWTSGDQRAVLGHARLAVVDVEGSPQPITNEDETIAIVVNGELYGYEVERAKLEARGHRFRTGGDSEIALHLYEEHGAEFVSHLRGEFALVLWDGNQRRLIAARDRFGVKPLCWSLADGVLRIASEAKALFAMGVAPRWDADAFLAQAAHQYLPPGKTLFAGVQQLRPGHLLVASASGVHEEPWFELSYPAEENRSGAPQEHVRALREALEDAVAERLRGDVKVAVQLSGGIDSSAVAGLAVQQCGPVDCFTVAFEEAAYDEIDVARRTAARLGSALHEVRVTRRGLIETLGDAVAQAEGPAINLHLSAKYLLSRALNAAGYKVVLTGEGSDELLSGYPHLRRDLLIASSAAGALEALDRANAVTRGIMLPHGDSLVVDGVRERLGFVPSFLEAKATLGARTFSMLEEPVRRDWFGELVDTLEVTRHTREAHPIDVSSFIWNRTALAGSILRTLGDGMEMSHSVEGRVPFLDTKVWEAARAMPVAVRIRDGIEKWVLREAVRDVVTTEVHLRPKHPFYAPPVTGEDGVLDEAAREVLFGEEMRAMPFYDVRALRALVERLPQMAAEDRVAWDPVLTTALCFAHLQLRYRPEAP